MPPTARWDVTCTATTPPQVQIPLLNAALLADTGDEQDVPRSRADVQRVAPMPNLPAHRPHDRRGRSSRAHVRHPGLEAAPPTDPTSRAGDNHRHQPTTNAIHTR
ncbi:hypothetical protein [Micromonospora sp. Llam0]|uniref:hypothetical protein n=1 Tax=Micromonospora sp. Llam0 TaxID=2485143 RepID=UPI000F4795AF|nr:hypothetical protein [Micromonospora sp. Llam0]